MRQSVDTFRILIVEDEPLTGLTLAEMLNEEGHRIIGPVATRKEALAALDPTRPDCVILDLSLNDGFCIGLVCELRARGTPFIVFSGHSRDRVAADALDGVPWVTKPARIGEIAAALRKALAPKDTTGGTAVPQSRLPTCTM